MFGYMRTAALAVAMALGLSAPQRAAAIDLTGYTLTFDDSFSSLSISDSKTFDGSRWYSKVIQCCMMPTDGLRSVMNGVNNAPNPFSLAQTAPSPYTIQLLQTGNALSCSVVPVPVANNETSLNIRLQQIGGTWSSGVLSTADSKGAGFSQMYGYFVMKAKFPTGRVTWPAFWMLDAASKQGIANALHGEIDILEFTNLGQNSYSSTLHDWTTKKVVAVDVHKVKTNPGDGDWHTYGMLWTPDLMTFYYDDVQVWQTATPNVAHQPYYMIIDLGMGAGWPTKDLTPAVNDMQVKYVRAYALPAAPAPTPTPTPSVTPTPTPTATPTATPTPSPTPTATSTP